MDTPDPKTKTKKNHVKFTLERVSDHVVPVDGKPQVLWDTEVKGLGLKAYPSGNRKYIYESRLKSGASIRLTIGDPDTWNDLDALRKKVRGYQVIVDEGGDPRQLAAERLIEAAAHDARARRERATLTDAWGAYLEDRAPHWSELTYRDHVEISQLGGVVKKRGAGLTKPGPLAPLMALRLTELTPRRIAGWLKAEVADRPARARLAFNLLRIFAGWCETKDEYRNLLDDLALAPRTARDLLPKRAAKSDVLQREQLKAWFEAVAQLPNPVLRTYLIGLLLCGARREELAGLKWVDVDFKWNSLTIRDKVDGRRVIPLTPYFASLLRELDRMNRTPPNVRQLRRLDAKQEAWSPSVWVFASPTSAGGRVVSPNAALHRVCEVAGVPPLTIHGLRRSFGSLTEWVEVPVGVVAQIMGHRPSATAERHYRVRPLDLLRKWHVTIEAWILSEAGISVAGAHHHPLTEQG
jgi:integrase